MQNKDLTSKYNEASLQVIRLSNLWQRNHNYFFQGNYNSMLATLNRIWIELSADAKRKNPKYFKQICVLNKHAQESIEKFNQKKEELYNLKGTWNFDEEQEKTLKTEIRQSRDKIFASIQGIELFLKDLQTEVGKGSSYRDLKEDSII